MLVRVHATTVNRNDCAWRRAQPFVQRAVSGWRRPKWRILGERVRRDEVREARRLVRMRAGLVRIRSRLKCQIHALLAEAGVGISMTDLFGRGGRELLTDLKLPAISQGRLEANLLLIGTLSAEVDGAEREIGQRFRSDPRTARLLPIPGIGPLGPATIIAEVWDVGRFASPERLTSWTGLTPTERSSADHTRRGHISKQGSRWLRWICVEASTNAVHDPDLGGRFAARIARRAA